MMITAQIERLFDGLKELEALLPTHYDELSEHGKRGHALNPQYDFYLAREHWGELLYVTLREDGKLVGYFVGFVTECLHYRMLTLTLDIIYVMPTVRGHKGGQMIMDCVRDECKRRDIKLWKMGLKEDHKKHMERLLLHYGFKAFETHYALWDM